MADPQTIDDLVDRLAANYRQRDDWRRSTAKTWLSAFRSVPDATMEAATESWIESMDKPPSISEMRIAVRQVQRSIPGEAPDGCSVCQRTGRLTVLALGVDQRTQRPWAQTWACRCDCPLGRSYSAYVDVDVCAQQQWARPGIAHVIVDDGRGIGRMEHSWLRHGTISPVREVPQEVLRREVVLTLSQARREDAAGRWQGYSDE